MTKMPYQLYLLTLRVWQEVIDGEEWEWRGEVKNTSSGEIRYFRDFHVLVHLLHTLLAQPVGYEVLGQRDTNGSFYSNQEREMSTPTQTVEAAINATNRAFETAYNRGDAAGAAAVYTSNGQALPPNGSTVTESGALQSFWQAVMEMGVKSITLETVELESCGECAYEVGKATLMGEGGTVLDMAKFIVVWQQEDGQWKWHRDIWNSNNSA